MMSFARPCRWACLVLVSGLALTASAASLAEWKSRSVYQTMTDRFARTDGSTTAPCNTTAGLRCGGTWRGTINHLDYIQGMGFDAIMISPVIENVEGHVSYGEAYHGYWQSNLYALNSHFGTHQDLLDLSDAVHSRGMYLMVDTVINNMAYITNGNDPATSIDYGLITPFNSSDYYHPYCKISDWNNYHNAQVCQTGDNLVALPDLFTEHREVQETLEQWAQGMIQTYSLDGLRIDAAKHVDTGFLTNFGQSIGQFLTGEVYERDPNVICEYGNNYINSVPNYPMYYALLDAFTMGNTTKLANQVAVMKVSCNDVTNLVSFSENHDVPRFPSILDDLALAKNVLTFTILFDGVPMIYQGQEQHFKGDGTPHNREAVWLSEYNTDHPLYQLVAKLNAIRKQAYKMGKDYVNLPSDLIFRGGSELAFTKGFNGRQVLMLLSTQGANSPPYPFKLPVSYVSGTELVEILNCKNYTVDALGSLAVPMEAGEPRVFFPARLLQGSGLCGYSSANISFAAIVTSSSAASSRPWTPSRSSSIVPVILGLVTSLAMAL